MYCTNCGVQLGEAERYCSQCGHMTMLAAQQPIRLATPARRLTRWMEDKKVAGVCSGLARYLEVDATLVRLLFLAFAIFTIVGFFVYLLAWVIMPKEYSVRAYLPGSTVVTG